MKKGNKITLCILLDAFRWDYLHPEDTPFLWRLKDKSVWIKKLVNPGRYCERSVFMTGAGPEITGNYFAFSLMPPGYKRADYEPFFNVPLHLRSRLAMTEDVKPDFEPGSFKVESIWDVMKKEGKKWAIEACIALGIKSYRGETTHGARPIQLIEKIKSGDVDFGYIQYSETDQLIHQWGTGREARKGLLRNIDGSVEWLANEAKKYYDKVNLIALGDHGMTDIREYIDPPLEYPPFVEGYDYLYLKSTAAIQFWIFTPKVEKYIKKDSILKKYGKFIQSPNEAQGDLIWLADLGIALSPCHFHNRADAPKAMHGYDEDEDDMKGVAIIYDGKSRGVVKEGNLKDICCAICDLVGIRYPKHCQGKSYLRGGERG